MSDAEVRAWAQSRGRRVSERGKVSKALTEEYNAEHGIGNGTAGPGHPGGPAGPDYPDGMTDADFDLAQATEPDLDEIPPSRPVSKAAGSRLTGGRLTNGWKRGGSSAKRKGSKPKTPRVSTADLIGSVWRIGAKLAQPVPPMYRVLRLESVIAGPLVDDAVKGTIADTVLQPLARLTRTGETVSALVAPPLAIGTLAWHLQQTDGNPNPVVAQACQEMLRHGLKAMMKVGGDAFAQQLAAEREDEERYGASVDAIMEWIMSAPAGPGEEEANIAAMAARFAGEPAPETMPA